MTQKLVVVPLLVACPVRNLKVFSFLIFEVIICMYVGATLWYMGRALSVGL